MPVLHQPLNTFSLFFYCKSFKFYSKMNEQNSWFFLTYWIPSHCNIDVLVNQSWLLTYYQPVTQQLLIKHFSYLLYTVYTIHTFSRNTLGLNRVDNISVIIVNSQLLVYLEEDHCLLYKALKESRVVMMFLSIL